MNINISPSVVNDLYLEKDKVYVVLKDGIVEANLNFSDNQKVKTIFHITGFKVNDIAQQQFQNKVFHHRQNDIDIRFSILDFGSVQTKALQYKLNNEDWKTISTESRNLQFKSLSPGEYSVAFKLGDEVLLSLIHI